MSTISSAIPVEIADRMYAASGGPDDTIEREALLEQITADLAERIAQMRTGADFEDCLDAIGKAFVDAYARNECIASLGAYAAIAVIETEARKIAEAFVTRQIEGMDTERLVELADDQMEIARIFQRDMERLNFLAKRKEEA